MASRLVACLLNVSEARKSNVVESIALSALASVNKSKENADIKASVLNIFEDFDYNRSVITIASDIDNIGTVDLAFHASYQLHFESNKKRMIFCNQTVSSS